MNISTRSEMNVNACFSANALKKFLSRITMMLSLFVLVNESVVAQTTVTYTMQTGNFNSLLTEKNNNPPFAGTYNNGGTEMAQYANGGSFGNTPGAAAFQTFTTSGVGTGTARTLRVGDRFTITCYVGGNPSAGGNIGISFRASTTYTNFFSATDASTVARFQLDDAGNWKVYSGSTAVATSTSGPAADRTFSIEITSANTFNATIGSETFYDLSFGTTGPISSFAIYTFGDANQNSFWKNGSLANFGHAAGDGVRLGYGLTSSSTSTISGIISDGLNTNSTSTSLVNVVKIGGGNGTSVTLSGTNTYTGATTINGSPSATLKLGNTAALGTSTSTTVNSGGTLDLNGVTLSTARPLTINGTGLSSAGALINTSGTSSTYSGTVALGADASVGGSGNITLNGAISGANNLTKVGAGTLTLGATNTFGGAAKSLTIAAGTVAITSFTNNLGNASTTVTLGTASTSGTLEFTPSTGNAFRSITVAAGGGTLRNIGTGTPTFAHNSGANTATLNGNLTLSCTSTGDIAFNMGISGTGGIIVNSSGSGKILMQPASAGSSTYTGSTTITSGSLYLQDANLVSNSSNLVLNGGTFGTGVSTGNSETLGTLALTANSTIALGTGSHTLTFSASDAVAWTAGRTLTITGWSGTSGATGSAGKIFVGSSSSGLTSTQLAQISFTGYGAATILSTGEIVPTATLYRSAATTGNWNNAATWESSTDGLTWSAAASTPSSTDGTITIRNGHTVTITVAVSIDQVTVDNGGIVIHSGAGTVTLADGTGTDLTINGTWRRTVSTHAISISSGATISVGSTGIYEHELAAGGGSIPTATWNSTSILRIKNNTSSSSALTNLAQTFGIVEVNTSTHTDAFVLDGITDVTNEFRIIQTGTGAGLIYTTSNWTITGSIVQSGGKFTNNFSNSASTTTIGGGLTISGGTFEVSNSGGSAIHSVIVNGNVLINGGSLEVNKSALTAGRLYVKGNLTLSSGSIVYTQGGTTGSSGIYFDGSSAQTFTHSGGTLSTATGGIGRRFYYKTTSGPTALNETYSGSSAQSTISGSEGTAAAGYAAWPTGSLISGFTVSNSAGVTLSTNKLITGTVTLSSGSLNLGGNTLTLNSGSSAQSVTGGGSNSFNVTNGTISLTGSGAHTITLSSFGTTSSGGLTLGTDVTLQMNSNAALNCGGNGTTTSMLTVLGTMQLNSGTGSNIDGGKPPFYGSASTLEYKVSYNVFDEWKSGTAITTPGVPQNVTINGSGITVTTPASERNVKGNLLISVGNFTLNAALGGDLKVAGNITNNATFTHSNRAVYLNGSSGSAQTLNGTLNGTTTTNCFPYLFLDNTSGGVTLNTAVNVTNTLTLTSGVITTNGNVFHITNGGSSAISGGGSSSYINGSLRRSITAGSGTWIFPTGKGGSYLPYGITNPAGSSLVVTAEAFATAVSGSPTVTAPLQSISSGEYWTVTNTGTFTSGTISLARGTIGSVNVVGSSTSAGGSYSSLGGGAVNSTLIASNTVTAASASTGNFGSPTYFVLGSASLPPTVSAVSASPNDGTNTNAYNGSTITVTGTNFTSGMTVTLSSGADVSADYTLSSATQITFALPTAASGTVTVQNAAGSATSSSSLVNVGYRTTTTGNYNNAATWLGGVAPSSSSDLTIAHNVTLNQNLTQTGLVKVNSGATLTVPLSITLQIADGIEGDGALAINGTLQINTGGYTVISPTYGNASTLIYNALEPYDRYNEWNATSGAGYPNNVVISGSGTILNLGNGGTSTARQLAGNLTVNAGSTLSLNESGAQMTAALTVKGNYTNSGTTTLSAFSGGDLKLEGNLADNGTFTANGRAIFFQGSSNQTISSTTSPLDIDVMRIAKSGGELILGTDLLADETGDPIQFTTATSILNLNGRTATFGKAGTASTITMTEGSAIKGSSTSSLTILGTGSAGTIRFDQTTPGTTNVLNNFTLSRTSSGAATLGNALIIAGAIDVEGGATLTSGGNLTLRSNATATARVADLSDNSGGTISGNVTVERYVQARRKWRALTAPLTGGSDNSIHFNWQNNGVEAGSTGAIMWRPGGSNGLYPAGVGSSILSYNSAANSWTQLTSTQTPSSLFSNTANNPYMVFVTGPFNTTGTYITSGSAPTTLSAKGALRTGDVQYTGSSLGGYVMIGNPYASPINLKTTLNAYGTRSGSGLSTTFVYVWNPGTASVGGYETINTASTSSIIIESGQAFFMPTTGASATLPFKESDKVSTTSNLTYFRTSDVTANPQISIDLNKYVNGIASKYDNATCDFVSGANAGIDGNDADKPTQFNENMSIFRDGKDLSWETRPSISVNDELPLRMWAMKQSGYQLKISTTNFNLPAGSTALLIDKFLNRETPITLNGTALVDFNVTSEAASSGDRFKVVFRSSAVTPVTNLNGEKGFAIYPNPVVKGTDMQLEFRNKAAGKYTLTVYSITGVQVQQNVVRHNGGTAVQVVGLNQRLSAGNYLVEVMNEKGDREQVRLTIQ